jgi:hypothetical protein
MSSVSIFWASATAVAPGGDAVTWNSAFVRQVPAYANAGNVDDYDPSRAQIMGHNVQRNGFQIVVFALTGDGKFWDIVCEGAGLPGADMALWLPDSQNPGSAENQTYANNTGGTSFLPYVDAAADAAYLDSDSTIVAPARAVIRHLLTAGKTYYLEVGSAYNDSNAPSGTGFDQSFTLRIGYTPSGVPNDSPAGAMPVVIPTSGQTYSNTVFNTGFAGSGQGGATFSNLYFSGWWVYHPVEDCTFSATFSTDPSVLNVYNMRIINATDVDPTQWTITTQSYNGTQPATLNQVAHANDTWLIQIGTQSENNSGHGHSQIYKLSVTGGKSLDQNNTVFAGPDNDHRQNAAVVRITKLTETTDDNLDVTESQGYYLSDYVDIEHATYVPNGVDDPTYDDAYMLQTVWWKYTPTEDGDVTVVAHSSPNSADIHLMVFKQVTSAGGIFKLGGAPSPTEWTPNADAPFVPGTTYYFSIGNDSTNPYTGNVQLDVTGPRTNQKLDPTPPVYVPPTTTTTTTPNKTATQPIVDSGSDTLLNLVRAFSVAVHQAVRITGPATIEMVDPDAPLPMGWSADDADDIYSSAVRTATSETKQVLSVNVQDTTLTGNANLITDDVRLLLSGWRIPDRLPVYDLPTAPVQRVVYTFTPTAFTATVEHHYPDVPQSAKRTT